MNKQLWQVVGFLAVVLATSSAIGQSNRSNTITDIPFTFTVANHTLPPGRYTVTHIGGTVVGIFNSHHQGTVALTSEVDGKVFSTAGKMVFHRYGNIYFLSEIWGPASGNGRKCFQSRAEREFSDRKAEMEIATLQLTH